ncbi:MAG TPA: hypothetical protein ENI23_09470 [bacterium]|nr:hypothetical protein [bacterium]
MKLQFSFLPIPEELMRSKAISWGAKHLWGIYAKANLEKIKWSARYLAKRMKCEVREARRRKAELIKSNLILVNPRRGRVDEVTINFELVHLIQEKTPVRLDRGQTGQEGDVQTGQGRDGRTGQGNSKERSLKKINKEGIKNFNYPNERRKLVNKLSVSSKIRTEAHEEASAIERPSGIEE